MTVTDVGSPRELLLQLLDASNRADPYALYRRIRESGPLHLPEANLTAFAGYDDCDAVLRHPSSASDSLKATAVQRQIAAGTAVRPLGTPSFLFLDPPDHTRLRGLVSKAFIPRVVRALEPEITRLVDELLDKVARRGSFEVIGDLAYPLPVAVICRLLGVPVADEPEFSSASAQLAQGLDPFATLTGAAADGVEDRLAAARWMREYLAELIAARRAEPRDDLLSGLIAAEQDGDQLTEDEIISTCNLLLIAGHETTVNLIANAILAMLRDRRQWRSLGADPARASKVVEETMRHDPPVQLVMRVAGEDMTIGAAGPSQSGGEPAGTHVPRGDSMLLLIAAAQRDPAAHPRPDDFDPDRATIRHLGFGKGPHFCLGAPLARLEASVALTAVTRRFPDARLDGLPSYKPNLTLRGMSSFPVAIGRPG